MIARRSDTDLLTEGYVVVDKIKLESLGDHSTRSTSTGDYSTGFSKKSHAPFSYHIKINSLQMMDCMVYLY